MLQAYANMPLEIKAGENSKIFILPSIDQINIFFGQQDQINLTKQSVTCFFFVFEMHRTCIHFIEHFHICRILYVFERCILYL